MRNQNLHDQAKSAFWAVSPIARKEVIQFWIRHALTVTRPNGTTRMDELTDIASGDCGFDIEPNEIAGALLMAPGRYLYPTPETRDEDFPSWSMRVTYVGVPANLQQQFTDLKAGA